jgi:hypothetical protein
MRNKTLSLSIASCHLENSQHPTHSFTLQKLASNANPVTSSRPQHPPTPSPETQSNAVRPLHRADCCTHPLALIVQRTSQSSSRDFFTRSSHTHCRHHDDSKGVETPWRGRSGARGGLPLVCVRAWEDGSEGEFVAELVVGMSCTESWRLMAALLRRGEYRVAALTPMRFIQYLKHIGTCYRDMLRSTSLPFHPS